MWGEDGEKEGIYLLTIRNSTLRAHYRQTNECSISSDDLLTVSRAKPHHRRKTNERSLVITLVNMGKGNLTSRCVNMEGILQILHIFCLTEY